MRSFATVAGPGVLDAAWSLPGAASGALAALGAWLVLASVLRARTPELTQRVEPYVRDEARVSRLLAGDAATASGPLSRLLRAPLAAAAGWVERILGGAASVARRQARAGQPVDVERFRAAQVVWGVLGAVGGLVLGTVIVLARHHLSVPPLVGLVLVGMATGISAKDWALSRAARRREQQMLTEFPTVAEMLALAVSAGEGASGALERVCRLSSGALAVELAGCLADARAGANLPTALRGLADRTGLASLGRFVDGIVVALERGTPLADVLRAQAQDVREDGRRRLMEEGGKREIAMMVPVVFLILPVTVVFALFPGLALLDLSV